MIYKILTVVLLSTFEIYAAIGTGLLAFNLSPHIVCLASLTGGIIGVFVAAFLGEKIKHFIAKYKKPKPPKAPTGKQKMMIALWKKYGEFGVGFIGTFFMGAPISIGIGIGFGVTAKRLIKWCLIAVIIRCIVFSYFFNYLKELF
jgi:membrane protein YqaA with SNARE-associated domain